MKKGRDRGKEEKTSDLLGHFTDHNQFFNRETVRKRLRNQI